MQPNDEVLTITDLTFRWRPEQPPILDLESLSVHRGERLFIRGASGSGKSTLLGLLGGVLLPQKGTVRILGQELPALSGPRRDRFRADHIGFVFQMFNLLPFLSPIENVLLPCRFSRLRREKAQRAGRSLIEEARRLLDHLDLNGEEQRVRRSVELSVGQQQRVAVARALIGSPELLIADEPTSALDWDRRRAFLELLERECQRMETTLIFVSHDASLEPLFDRTLFLERLNRTAPPNTSRS